MQTFDEGSGDSKYRSFRWSLVRGDAGRLRATRPQEPPRGLPALTLL